MKTCWRCDANIEDGNIHPSFESARACEKITKEEILKKKIDAFEEAIRNDVLINIIAKSQNQVWKIEFEQEFKTIGLRLQLTRKNLEDIFEVAF